MRKTESKLFYIFIYFLYIPVARKSSAVLLTLGRGKAGAEQDSMDSMLFP